MFWVCCGCTKIEFVDGYNGCCGIIGYCVRINVGDEFECDFVVGDWVEFLVNRFIWYCGFLIKNDFFCCLWIVCCVMLWMIGVICYFKVFVLNCFVRCKVRIIIVVSVSVVYNWVAIVVVVVKEIVVVIVVWLQILCWVGLFYSVIFVF